MSEHKRTIDESMREASAPKANQRAFTLIELLVTMVIIALLLSLVAVAYGPFRAAANQTDSLGALRQMATGFNSYTTDHAGQLMPGYLSDALANPANPPYLRLTARDRNGKSIPPQALKSYVWRLAPYVDHAWETMLNDYKEPEITSKATNAAVAGIYTSSNGAYDPVDHFLVAEQPSFGMNSIYVGGDAVHGGSDVVAHNPFTGTASPAIGARRMSQIKSPGRLIVFGSVAKAAENPDVPSAPYASDAKLGTAELRAPYINYNHDAAPNAVQFEHQQWTVGDRKQVLLGANEQFNGGPDDPDAGGIPIMRWSKDKLPVAKVDGSTAAIDIGVLADDMRHWAWQATGIDPPRTSP